MMHNLVMRTTVTLNDETHEFASYYARAKGISLGSAIDELIRKAQRRLPLHAKDFGRLMAFRLSSDGKDDHDRDGKKLEEDEFDPEKFA